MTIFILPDEELFCPEEFHIQIRGNVQVNVSPLNASTQTVELPGDRMVFTLIYGPHHNADLPPLRAFWNRFRGQAHVLRLWNLVQPVPLGTMRGSPTLSGAHGMGWNSLTITTTFGATLKAGDWVGVTTPSGKVQTVEVVSDSTGTGPIVVGVNPPLREGGLAGAAVIWSKPYVDCLLTSAPVIPHGHGSKNQIGTSDGFTIEAVEFIT